MGNVSLNPDGGQWKISSLLFGDSTVLLGQSEEWLQWLVRESDDVCKRRSLMVNAGKNKVMVFETQIYSVK